MEEKYNENQDSSNCKKESSDEFLNERNQFLNMD
jgi:hypothetical protein